MYGRPVMLWAIAAGVPDFGGFTSGYCWKLFALVINVDLPDDFEDLGLGVASRDQSTAMLGGHPVGSG